ncbi:MAG: hypothetical protein K0R61_1562, partial [Microvirga sp.]|nr:hypothetical protein [Microvirga sp.]
MEDHLRLELAHDLAHPLPVAHVGNDAVHIGVAGQERRVLENVVQGRLGAFQNQKIACPESHRAGADLGPDGAAAARDQHALAADEGFQPLPVDLHGGAQEQVFDFERRKLGVAHALAEARDPHEGQAETSRAGEQHVRVR